MDNDNLMSFRIFKILYPIFENGYLVLDQEAKIITPLGITYAYGYCGLVPFPGPYHSLVGQRVYFPAEVLKLVMVTWKFPALLVLIQLLYLVIFLIIIFSV